MVLFNITYMTRYIDNHARTRLDIARGPHH